MYLRFGVLGLGFRVSGLELKVSGFRGLDCFGLRLSICRPEYFIHPYHTHSNFGGLGSRV